MLILTDDTPRDLGWYMIDHRAPGTPTIFGNNLFEAHTYTCKHCTALVVMNPDRKRPRYKCKGCEHHICDPCSVIHAAGAPCVTMQEAIDKMREAALRNEVLTPAAASPYL